MELKKKLSKRETQMVLLHMLDDLTAYLDRHHLRYYLVGGTLLGAVRHKGFIPWDDDIDIGMPRSDYENFLEIVQKEPVAPKLQLISDRFGTFTNPFSELIRMDTHLERGASAFIREECTVDHLFIDIIPQDGWPEDEKQAAALFYKMKRLRYLLQCGRAKTGEGTSTIRKLAKIPFILLARVIGIQRILDRMDRIARSYDYDHSKYVGAVTYGIYGTGERCLREQTLEFQEVEFEGKMYHAPGSSYQYLKQIYGDYMKLPPPEKRTNHKMQVWLLQ